MHYLVGWELLWAAPCMGRGLQGCCAVVGAPCKKGWGQWPAAVSSSGAGSCPDLVFRRGTCPAESCISVQDVVEGDRWEDGHCPAPPRAAAQHPPPAGGGKRLPN